MSSLVLRLFLALLTLASLGHVGALLPRFVGVAQVVPGHARVLVWGLLVTILTAVGACALALVLVARSWRSRGARSLALFLVFLAAVWGSLLRFLDVDIGEESVSATFLAQGWDGALAFAGLLLATAAFLRFSSLFPSSLSPTDLPPPRRLRALRTLRVLLFRPGVVWGVAVLLLLLQWGLGVLLQPWITSVREGADAVVRGPKADLIPFLVGFIGIGVSPLLGIGLGIRNLASGFHLASPADRKRVLWLVAGVSASGWMVLSSVLGGFLAVILDLPGWIGDTFVVLLVLAPAVLVVSCAVALFYAGSLDPGLVLRRSTVYGAMGALGILLFAGLEEVLSSWVALRLGLPGVVGSLLAGSLAAGVMIPLRKTLGRVATRVLPGQDARSKGPDGRQGSDAVKRDAPA